MNFFKSNSPFLPADVLRAVELLPPPTLETAASGDPTLKINGVAVASAVDPRAEGKKFAAAAEGMPRVMVYGFGLGYHLEALLASTALQKLVVVEASLPLVGAALHGRDLAALLRDPRLTLIAADTEAAVVARLAGLLAAGEGYEILIHQPSFRILPQSFGNLRNILETIQSERRFSAFFREQERRNIAANIPAIAASPGVASLFSVFAGKPAVVAGAGPSLDRALRHLDRLRNRAHVIAVDTAAGVLARNGIRCHAVISADPQPMSVFHFAGGMPDAPLIFIPTTHPAVVAMYRGRRYLMLQERHTLFAGAEPLLPGRGSSGAGGSVSCLALDMLLRAGAGPLFFTGQDFAFSQGMPYNRDTLAQYASETPLAAAGEQGMLDAAFGFAPPLTVSLEGGGEGDTAANLRGYLQTFNELIAAAPRTRFFNLDSRGAVIRGCRNLTAAAEALGDMPAFNIAPLPQYREKPDAALEAALLKSVAE
ncbi:MAG: motility associated factor glycosyltransferase family protein [Nitrospinae bacterium]|nr:motility associated factor glycosyltransferase family protein [Nitrospinota bacterium]